MQTAANIAQSIERSEWKWMWIGISILVHSVSTGHCPSIHPSISFHSKCRKEFNFGWIVRLLSVWSIRKCTKRTHPVWWLFFFDLYLVLFGFFFLENSLSQFVPFFSTWHNVQCTSVHVFAASHKIKKQHPPHHDDDISRLYENVRVFYCIGRH